MKEERSTRGIRIRNETLRKAKLRKYSYWILIFVSAIILIWILFTKFYSPSEPLESQSTGLETSPPSQVAKQYSSEPPMSIDISKEYFAHITLANGGKIIIQLFSDQAPRTVNSFVFLARDGYYDGVTFHRVLENFMAQTGDPTGSGTGGPGYEFINEDNELRFDKSGMVAMANHGRDTNGSQFFITLGQTPWLNGDYTIFGQVVSGMDVVNSLTLRDPQTSPNYLGDQILTVSITD